MVPVGLKEMYHLLFTDEERDSERWSDKSRITQPADEGTWTRTWLPTPITGFLSLTWKFTPHLNLGTRSWWLESLFSGSFSLWSGFPAPRANWAVKQIHSLWKRHGALGDAAAADKLPPSMWILLLYMERLQSSQIYLKAESPFNFLDVPGTIWNDH